jgi:hypothetical protein
MSMSAKGFTPKVKQLEQLHVEINEDEGELKLNSKTKT